MQPTPEPSTYIEDGYNIILTDAPKVLGGRLFLNCARTMPLLPFVCKISYTVKRLSGINTYHVAE